MKQKRDFLRNKHSLYSLKRAKENPFPHKHALSAPILFHIFPFFMAVYRKIEWRRPESIE